MAFDGVDGIDDGRAAAGHRRSSHPPLDDPDTLWVHDLIGAVVDDTGGTRLGTVVSVEANPASDLLVLDGGALIPLRFVVGGRCPGGVSTVELPDGLLDLA